MESIKKIIIHNSLFIILFLLAFLERAFFDLGPNYELMTSAIVLSGFYLKNKNTLWATLVVLILSDLLIGNTNIFLFTWSGSLIPAFIFSRTDLSTKTRSQKRSVLITLVLGLFTNFFFFIWSNLGVWLLDSWGMYSRDINGLIICYINALPFLKNQIVSTLIFIPTGIATISFVDYFLKSINRKYRQNNNRSYIS